MAGALRAPFFLQNINNPFTLPLQRLANGRKYYDFEFTAKSKNYTRHAVASVTVGNGEGRGFFMFLFCVCAGMLGA